MSSRLAAVPLRIFAVTLIVVICSCDSNERVAQNESSDSAITGKGVGYDASAGERPATDSTSSDYPNRRKHTFLHPFINTIGANLDVVKFFEGPYYPPPKEQRQYRIGFDARRARYINWELNLTHQPPGRVVSFRIDAEWYQGGELFYRYSTDNSIQADWESSYMSHSYSMAPWVQGIYRVDLSIGGQKIASEYFDVYNSDCSGDLSLAGANEVENARRQNDPLLLAVALHNRAGQCFINGNLDAAYEDFSEAIRIEPTLRMAYYHRALVLMDWKRYKEALSDLDAAIRVKEYDDYYAARAHAHFMLENDGQALSDLNNAIDMNSESPEHYQDRGIVWYYLGEDENALRDLKQAASMYQSENEQRKLNTVSEAIDILEGRRTGTLMPRDRGRLFTLAKLSE
jgi:tetratricopeptide (TPR) repeat protein